MRFKLDFTENFSLLKTIKPTRPFEESTMAGITVAYLTENKKIQELDRLLTCLNAKSLDVSLDISVAQVEIERAELFAPVSDKARSRLPELQAKVRDLLRKERQLESQIQRVKERIQAEADKDRRQAQQDSKTEL